MDEHGARQTERIRDLEARTYHAVDDDRVRCEILDFSLNIISRALAKQGRYYSLFPGLFKGNP